MMEKRELHISNRNYVEMMELKSRLDGYEDHSAFVAEIASRWNLKPFTEYQIVIDR